MRGANEDGQDWRLWSPVLARSRAARMCGPRKAGFIYKGLIIPERGQAQVVPCARKRSKATPHDAEEAFDGPAAHGTEC